MHLLLVFRFVLGLLCGGLQALRTERKRQWLDRSGCSRRRGDRRPCWPGVVWMNVRLGPKRFGIPPGRYQVVPATEHVGGGRRLTGYRLRAAGPFCHG